MNQLTIIENNQVEMSNHSVKRNFAYSAAYQILNIIVPLITTPYLSRTIGAVGNGLFSYTQSIANYFVLFAQLGITNYGVREIARCGNNRALRSLTFWEIFAMNFAWGIAVVACYLFYIFAPGSTNSPLLLIWLCWVVGSVVDVTWLLNGCQEFKIPMVRNFITRTMGMVFIFIFVRTESDTWAYVTAIAMPFLLNALLVWPFVNRYVDIVKPTLKGALAHLRPNLLLFIPVIAVSFYTLLDKVMLGAMAGLGQAGMYDYAEKVSKMPLAVVTALGSAVLPKMTEVISSGRKEEARRLVQETMWFMEAVAMGLAFGIVGVANEFVPVFFGAGYDECIPLMSLLSCIIPLICATNVIGVQYLVPLGRDNQYTLSVLVGAAVNVVINIVGIPRYGAIAASAATVAAEAAVLVSQMYMVKGELGLRQSAPAILPYIIFGASMALAIRLLALVLGNIAVSIFGLAIEILFGATIYIVLSFFWCLLTKEKHFYNLFGQWLNKSSKYKDWFSSIRK